jgi:NAD(P)-dependent dehydrogenase (short-subunit alcohol dehydrogenase family)
MEIKGKVVLITGASGALGQSVVPTFVSAGASVILGDLNPISCAESLGSTRISRTGHKSEAS